MIVMNQSLANLGISGSTDGVTAFQVNFDATGQANVSQAVADYLLQLDGYSVIDPAESVTVKSRRIRKDIDTNTDSADNDGGETLTSE